MKVAAVVFTVAILAASINAFVAPASTCPAVNGPGSFACTTHFDGPSPSTVCCGADQICCNGSNQSPPRCCSKATEECALQFDQLACIPKPLPTVGPNPPPGEVLWRTQLDKDYQAISGVSHFNSTHVLVAATNVYLLEQRTGAKTFVGVVGHPQEMVFPVGVDGRYVLFCTNNSQTLVDTHTGESMWSNASVCDTVIVAAATGNVFIGNSLYRIMDGQYLWTAQPPIIPGDPRSPKIDEVIGFDGDAGVMYIKWLLDDGFDEWEVAAAYSLATGKRLFVSEALDVEKDTVFLANGLLVYHATSTPAAGFKALNGTTGALVWFNPRDDFEGPGSIVSHTDEAMIITRKYSSFWALSTRNGSELWAAYKPVPSEDSMTLGHVNIYGSQHFIVSNSSGQNIWPPVRSDTHLLFFDMLTGDSKQLNLEGNMTVGGDTPFVVGDILYITTNNYDPSPHGLSAYDIHSGKLLKSWTFGGEFQDGFVVENNIFMAADLNGYVTGIKLLN